MISSSLPLIDTLEGFRLSGDMPAVYLDTLPRFTQDPTMNRLKDALLRFDANEAFLHAHTLKGTSAQLALPRLYAASASLCDLLRRQTPEGLALARNQLPDLLEIYQQTIKAIAIIDP